MNAELSDIEGPSEPGGGGRALAVDGLQTVLPLLRQYTLCPKHGTNKMSYYL